MNGAQKYAVRVQVDPDKLRAQLVGINEVDQALQNWNVNLPTGQLFGAHQTFNLKAGGQLNDAADLIGAVAAPDQRTDLTAIYDTRLAELSV